MKSIKQNGFTMVELLVTIAIIVVFSAIAVPISLSLRDKSRQVKCIGNLKQIGVGLHMYLGDNSDILPELAMGRSSKDSDEPVIETVLAGYVESEEVFRCPCDHEEYRKTGCSYHWNITQNGRDITDLSFFGNDNRPEVIPLVSDKEAWHNGKTNFLYADSSSSDKVRFVSDN